MRIWNVNDLLKGVSKTVETEWEPIALRPVENRNWLLQSDTDDQINVWDCSTWQIIRKLSGNQQPHWALLSIKNNTEEVILLSGGTENWIKVWNVETGENINNIENDNQEFTFCFLQVQLIDGSNLIASGHEGDIVLWK